MDLENLKKEAERLKEAEAEALRLRTEADR
jgi:hypothetical protein